MARHHRTVGVTKIAGMVFVLASFVCSARQDGSIIVSTVDLNCDCVQDTLVATTERKGRATRLSAIVWGKRTDSTGCDSAWYSGRTTRWRKQTKLKYPDWEESRTSVSTVHGNHDTYKDLLLSFRGVEPRVRTKQRGTKIDTVRFGADTTISIVVYAQRGLDSLSTLDCSVLMQTENDSLVVRHINQDSDFEDRQRTTSGITAAKFKRVSAVLNVPSEEMQAQGGSVLQPLVMRVFPNPTSDGMLVVEADVDVGTHVLTVFDAIGRQVEHRLVPVESASGWQFPIILRHVPPGVYTVVLRSQDGSRFSSQSVFVVH